MKVKNNLLNIGLLLVVFAGLNPMLKAYPPSGIDTTSYGAYKITNIAELKHLSNYINNVDGVASYGTAWTSAGKTFILMNDIEGNFDKSIGTALRPFSGIFDGNGKKNYVVN